ncbi:TetR/AcrR family transcriptional regulator [Actinoplanes sp. N902-109]|uniref:TetR/AcrR family transcriptional regulator n=1 Tax=Actinoplanes sp. (strain N902-109) TaxID=649831 RepID=UPI00032933F9|nr:TetR/AcrR family transcriptional regulator [Actinoplanes sp. N902-109]AGL20451.1 TetR family transcriptional regulator [Actinoplanes sp. N902-109]
MDPDRILPLLWRHRTAGGGGRTGRRPTLSIDAVVDAGIAIADDEGLAATSMAKVAARLGVGTMTLYTYVPSRTELVDLMVDQVSAAREWPTGPGWRDRVVRYARSTLTMYREHPWLSRVPAARPPLGPGTFREREFLLAAVAAAGLPTAQVNRAAVAIGMLVTAAARQEGESALLRRETGMSDDTWWRARGRFWAEWFDEAEHPTMTRLWHADGYGGGPGEQAASAFDYGLHALLDAIDHDAKASGPIGHDAKTSGPIGRGTKESGPNGQAAEK